MLWTNHFFFTYSTRATLASRNQNMQDTSRIISHVWTRYLRTWTYFKNELCLHGYRSNITCIDRNIRHKIIWIAPLSSLTNLKLSALFASALNFWPEAVLFTFLSQRERFHDKISEIWKERSLVRPGFNSLRSSKDISVYLKPRYIIIAGQSLTSNSV